jgi:hypothetical protein
LILSMRAEQLGSMASRLKYPVESYLTLCTARILKGLGDTVGARISLPGTTTAELNSTCIGGG